MTPDAPAEVDIWQVLASLHQPIAIVAHDAGSANLIAAWFAEYPTSAVRGLFAGPAAAIFRKSCSWMDDGNLGNGAPAYRTIISGTGWSSTLEHDAREFARARGIRSIAVLDHWTNYRARFSRRGREILPDEIWVVDEYACELARSTFPDIPVIQLRNVYLENLVREVRKHEKQRTAAAGRNVLYTLEPIRDTWGTGQRPGEFQALDYFVAHLDLLRIGQGTTVRLRPHPSDPEGKYDSWLASHRDLNIGLDKSPTLAAGIAWSDVVVGCQTYAMVIALSCGKRVISSIPAWAPPCVLPQTGIQRLAQIAS